ncbi:hypothetical protein JHU04_002881 [Brenneria sp. 4F2]|nr:hypothetical protein [Brenneria bubanii]
MKLVFLLLALLVTLCLCCLLVKLWLLTKRKAQLHRLVFNGRQLPVVRSAGKKRLQRRRA